MGLQHLELLRSFAEQNSLEFSIVPDKNALYGDQLRLVVGQFTWHFIHFTAESMIEAYIECRIFHGVKERSGAY